VSIALATKQRRLAEEPGEPDVEMEGEGDNCGEFDEMDDGDN
jgi:hypothetical protein